MRDDGVVNIRTPRPLRLISETQESDVVAPFPLRTFCAVRHGIWFVGRLQPPSAVGAIGHFKVEGATLREHLMRKKELVVRFAIHQQAFDETIAVAHPLGTHLNSTSVGQRNAEVRQIGSTNHILIAARTYRIKAQRRENIPRRHLSAIIVAPKATNIIAIHAVHDGAHPLLRLPGFLRPGIEVRHMVARFVAVYVSPDEAVSRNVLVVGIIYRWQIHAEERIEPLSEHLLAPHHGHQPKDIMRRMEREVPSVALYEALIESLIGIQISLESPVAIARAGKSRLRMEDVAVRQRAFFKLIGHRLISHSLRRRIDGPIIVGIFQRVGSRGSIVVVRGISQHTIVVEARQPPAPCRSDHGVEGA